MTDVSAAAVKALREKTNLPMMDCKRALEKAGGDEEAAIRMLREEGKKTEASRIGRETNFGKIAVYIDSEKPVAAMVELQCESDPVARNEEFLQLANDLAKQLALGPGASTPEELLKQPSPSHPGKSLGDVKDDLFNKIREVFNVSRLARIDGAAGGYSHHMGSPGVLVEVEGNNPEVAKQISMHIAFARPTALAIADLDPAAVEKEREILLSAARAEGKPEQIIGKMVEGRMRNYYAEKVLEEQPYFKDDKQTVKDVAQAAGLKIKRFLHWRIGE